MSAPQPRILETYNSLTDKHLVGYFSNARIRRHLQKSGLISRSGRIIPEKEYRLNAIRRNHQRHVQECLADAIYHKVLDMEYHHQLGMSRRLNYSARKEMMQPVKMEPLMGEVIHMYSPHPPIAPRNHHALCPLVSGKRTGRSQRRGPRLGVDYGDGRYYFRSKEPACCKVSSLRPNRAPGNTQQPPRLQPLLGWAAAGSVSKASKQKGHALGHYQQFACGGESRELRFRNPMEYMAGVSPYQPPAIRRRRRAVPVPPPRPHVGDRCIPGIRRGLPVERWFHPTTGFNEQFLINNTNGFPKSPLCSNALVTMIYLGKSKHVSLRDYKDEIKVYQQYCGTENICVYKGDLLEGDTFQFISKRYLGYPFSLTFYLNGLQVDRLSCCCEYRGFQCKRPSRLRRRNTYFRVLHVAGAPPCYRCFLAMGLDKKLFPPKRKLKFYTVPHMCSCSPFCAHSEPCENSVLQKSIEGSVSLTIPSHEETVETIDETLDSDEESSEEDEEEDEEEEEAEMEDQSYGETEDTTQENTSESEYDEDFEADEEVNEEGQTGDQMNGMSESSSDDKNHNLDHGQESETSSQKALQAPDSEKDESGGYPDGRDSEDDLPERRPADSLSSMSTQHSTETGSQAEMKADPVSCKEDCNIKSTPDSVAHEHYGKENGEKKLLRVEENQENSALEKKGIDEAEKTKPEDLTAREDTRIFHENIMGMQHQNPEVNGEFKQTGSGESNMNEEEKCPPVPWESRVLGMEDGNEESPWCEEGVFEDCKPVQEEIAKATGNDHPVNPEPGDLCANEEEKNTANTERGASGAPDGTFLAEGRRSRGVQEAAGQAVGAGEPTGPGPVLEQDAAAEGDAGSGEAAGKAAGLGDSLPPAGTGAVLEESAPEEGAVAEEHPKGKGTGAAVKLGTAVSPGEQEVLVEGTEREVALGKPAAGGEGPAGALPGWEAHRAVPRGQEGAGGTGEEEAAEEGLRGAVGLPAEEEEVGEAACEAGESLGQGGSAGKDTMVGAVSEGEEPGEDADVAAGGSARAVGPEGEKAVEEDFSEGEEAMGKPRVLWEALGDMETGEAVSGGEGFVKPSQFSQLKVSEVEQMEMGKAVPGAAATLESAQALQRVEDTMEEPVEPDKGPVLEVAPGLGALGGARGDPVTEGSSQVEEGAAEALRSGNRSEGSKAETDRAVEAKPEGEAVAGSAGAAGAGSGDEEQATDGAAASEEPAAGTEGWLRRGQVKGKGRSPGEGLVAIAVLGGQPGPGALPGGPAGAGAGGVGGGAMAQEGVTGAELGAQSGAGAEERSAAGRAVKREAAAGCEARAAAPAEGREPGAGPPGQPAGLGARGLRERPTAEPNPSSPVPGHGGVAPGGTGGPPGGEGLCPGAPPPAAPAAGAARGRDGRQEQGMERAAARAQGEQPRPCGSSAEGELADVAARAGAAAAAGEPRKDGAVGGSPGVPAGADEGQGSRRSRQDITNPDPLIMSSEEDGEETLL
ncbi:glutamate-rich protein 3 isoform X3 [Motacilla alba alba]|uniref:glutamate-rich protein 3 isoform X3 n=1 Tax=Motacilla alba alba TaxID=1094192 RepID=UPI0018D593C2|nr:glutamate-rich protein 3 isoform X3 [Motacilla alba alba]